MIIYRLITVEMFANVGVLYIFEFLGNTDLVSTVLGSYTQFYILRQVYLWEVVCSVGASLDSHFTLIHPIVNIILQPFSSPSWYWTCPLWKSWWSLSSSGNLRPRVRGSEGNFPEGGGGCERRSHDLDQVARDDGHQRLPTRWQLQSKQETVRDGSVVCGWNLRTNQVVLLIYLHHYHH